MTGLDPVEECVALARERVATRGLAAEVYAGSIATAALPRSFDFIFSWFCYSYIPRTRVVVLRKVGDHLRPDGRILISDIRRA